ncbi:MAG: heme-dependent oxidative N-demethylase subunit alpha family protein [Myxococcota bacterium]
MAHYFPVSAAPLRMVPSLLRFGVDLGMGELDGRYFQVDAHYKRYIAAKRASPAKTLCAGVRPAALSGVADWMAQQMNAEGIQHEAGPGAIGDRLRALGDACQEDFAILHEGKGGTGETLAVDVRFPSGWHPERLLHADFAAIHGPVPDFPASDAASRAMVRGMVHRGPYVRFVWTLSPTDTLDQHPDRHDRAAAWRTATQLFLRVERQVTVPFPDLGASLFLIRVFHTPLEDLKAAERKTLLAALDAMPDDVRRYKGLPDAATREALLRRCSSAQG